MRLYVSLVVTALVAMLLLTACNSNESALPIVSNSPSPASGQSTNRPPVSTSTPFLLPSTQSPSTVPSPAGEEPRRITPEELKSKLDSGQAILIDVRGEAAYNQSHIKGSRQIPFAEIAAHADELPRNKLIATYCSWPAEHTSAGAVLSLRTKGINNAAAVLGGFEALKAAGYQAVTGSQP